MSQPTLLIVGGGLAGLSAGVYAQSSGYRTTIFERHTVPGGVCTAWKRGAYTFDGCIHWLMGASPGRMMHRLYQEVGGLDQVSLLPIETYSVITDEGTGAELAITRDLDRLIEDTRALSPGDGELMAELVELARKVKGFDMRADEGGLLDRLSWTLDHRHELWAMVRHRETVAEWRERARSRVLRDGLLSGIPDLPVAFLAALLGGLEEGSIAHAIGGSRRFSDGVAERYRRLGGTLRLGEEVDEILVENDRAVGVRLASGEEMRADRVISAAPGHTTIYRLLGGRYTSRRIAEMYTAWPIFDGIGIVSIGASRTWFGQPPTRQVLLDPGLKVAHRELSNITIRDLDFDPGLAPPGHTIVQMLVEADYDYWSELHHSHNAYMREKDRLASSLIERAETWLPGLAKAAVEVDVATPYTYWWYTRAWRGAYEGWKPRADSMRHKVDKTLPGLGHFHMVGQWVEPGGGVPAVIASGRDGIQRICKEDDCSFHPPELD